MSPFICASVTPLSWPHPGLAVATARAGGIPLLDIGLPTTGQAAALTAVLDAIPIERPVGLRVPADQLAAHVELLALLHGKPHWLVIHDWPTDNLGVAISGAAADGRQVWLEVSDGRRVAAVADVSGITGWVARGAECGGRVGPDSAYLLAQRLAAHERPFLVQGGIGPDTAAACRAAGAAGVVLEEQLWLMRESPLPAAWRAVLERLSGADCKRVGPPSAGWRVAVRPDLPAAARLAAQPDAAGHVGTQVGWGPPDRFAWPVGQAIASAGPLARKYKTAGRFIRALMEQTDGQVAAAARLAPLGPGSQFAAAHGTRYPVVQGPMTRVSDRAEFAAAVAAAGGLPFLALALLDRDQTRNLLIETRQAVGNRPWGVGLLGFIDPDRWREQLAEVKLARPPFALIAGGRPDQAAELEAQGIPTYVHAPSPVLVRSFWEQGVRRFVLEGAECGGHVGPMTSFALWQAVADVLRELAITDPGQAARTYVLFAGGVHDGRSAGMVAALAAPLTAAGLKVGVLMGTAYLFTREAVVSGAIVPDFQEQAVGCRETVELVVGPGHAIRCAVSPFAAEFEKAKAKLQSEGRPPAAVADELERLTLGRARVASKGLVRNSDRLAAVDRRDRQTQGMYMMGAAATLRTEVTDLAGLHEEVSAGSVRLLAGSAGGSTLPAAVARPARVAIIGASCLLPGAQDVGRFWRNLLDKVDTVTEVPARRWDWRRYYDPDPRAADKSYSKWGAFLDEVPFDPIRYGIPPRSLKSISPMQLLALEVARRALEDAGYADGEFDRSRTAVVAAVSCMADLEEFLITRSTLGVCEPQAASDVLARLPEWSEESFPGILTNVVAGRVASRFDFGGPNYAVDAACASGLAAVDLGVRELLDGRADLALVTGAEAGVTPFTYLCFSKTRALSPDGRVRAFYEGANGIVLGEGFVGLLLKRLEDAERDGDRIYAVIQGTGGSSDGRGQGLTAPKSDGQRLALDRAYARAGVRPDRLGLYEAHGTGTALGDRTELETLVRWLGPGAAAGAVAVGSAKSLVGHTKAAAGLVGLLKCALALHHRVLPPHAGVGDPLGPLNEPNSPVYLPDEARPWPPGPAPRLAGVSAFGFGGTNFHTVLEEYRGAAAPAGADDWPGELVVVAGMDDDRLRAGLRRVRAAASREPAPRLRDLAYTLSEESRSAGPAARTAAVVAGTVGQLQDAIDALLCRLDGRTGDLPAGTYLGTSGDGPVALLFPGQGTVAPGMCREAALYAPELPAAVIAAAGVAGADLHQLIWPPAAVTDAAKAQRRDALARTGTAQPAIGAIGCGWLDLLVRLGLRPGWAAGHSFGELTALHAAGAVDRPTFLRLAVERGRVMEAAAGAGAMAAVRLSRAELVARLQDAPDLALANHNSPSQCVVSGPADRVDGFIADLAAEKVAASRLTVTAAFHSPQMRPTREPWAAALAAHRFAAPTFLVTTAGGDPYAPDPAAVCSSLARQIEGPVDFVRQVEHLYRAGARVFVEAGPGDVLSGLVRQILAGLADVVTVPLDRGGWRGFLGAVGELVTHGAALDWTALFHARDCRIVELDRAVATPATDWLVDGGRVRHRDEPVGSVGREPLVTADTPIPRVTTVAHRSATPGANEDLAGDDVLTAYHEYQETMRRFLSTQEKVMARMLDRVDGTNGFHGQDFTGTYGTNGAQTTEQSLTNVGRKLPPARPVPAADPAVTWAEPRAALGELTALVSSYTGYPPEVLNPDQDIEGDLGLDSLKRLEILSEVQKRLPTAVANRLRDRMDQLSRVRSLRGMTQFIIAEFTAVGGAAIPTPAAVASELPTAARSSSGCPRLVIRATSKPLTDAHKPLTPGLVLVTEDRLGAADALTAELRFAGVVPHLIPLTALADPAALRQAVDDARLRHGPVRAVVHLAPLAPPTDPADADGWRHEARIQTKGLFHLLQLVASEPEEKGGGPPVVAATRFGGHWGRDGAGGLAPPGGGVHGLLRAYGAECSVATRTVDFDDTMTSTGLARCVLAELTADGDEPEVGYPKGQRTVCTAVRAPVVRTQPRDWRLGPGAVLLATGGASGITAELVAELAAPGVRLVLVGQSADGDPELADYPDANPAGLRKVLVGATLARGELAVPAAIEHRVRREVRHRSRLARLANFRSTGAEVEYYAVDVRDGSAFGQLIEDVYARHGRIDAVIHGAGRIEDTRLADKTSESYDRVFDTKVESALTLTRNLNPTGLKWVALLGSVSGRFGNPGQTDYAAANELLNRAAWGMARRWPATRVVCLNWGPWRAEGMADAPTLRRLAVAGIRPIEPAAGRAFFADELAYGSPDDVEVIAGDGPWAADEPGESLASVLEVGLLLMSLQVSSPGLARGGS
ncbi:MAG TPA: SDR family NAD(P)-dependent oxidoreductase [Gemmataceae bacterium]|jgi:acyl transferase domain-containing protein/NAD(P)H-dependent flavin oxidoreductase YrpB (nitropropane dioxygenase family)/NADP-dependent 3-hydroxy acid dehydrogenase YdfG|nr:SDR family NAD(P)-dependent oxidoreductase [Gemmataceae bacterium]